MSCVTVAVNSALGAVEIGSLGNDLSVNDPQLGAAFDVSYALNPDSVLIPVARLGGLTTAVVTPCAEEAKRTQLRLR